MEKYLYSGGQFVNVGNTNWQEWQQKQLIFHFKETERDNGWITLYDASRNIWVALPKGGGKSYYAWGGDSDWTELYNVRRELIPAQIIYTPGCTFKEFAKCAPNNTFFNQYLQPSTKLDGATFDKAVYLLGRAVNGLSSHPSNGCVKDYDSLVTNQKDEYNRDHVGSWRCQSSCGMTILGLWRALGFPNDELWGPYPYKGRQQVQHIMPKVIDRAHTISGGKSATQSGDDIFAIGNVIGVEFGTKNTHYFMVSSYPSEIKDNTKPLKCKYIFVGINGGGSHGRGCLPHGYQIIRTAKMEAWQTRQNTWKVNKLDVPAQSWIPAARNIQFYYKTKSMLLGEYHDRCNSRMPFGIGNNFLGVSTWNIVPDVPSGHGYQNEYFKKIVNPFFRI